VTRGCGQGDQSEADMVSHASGQGDQTLCGQGGQRATHGFDAGPGFQGDSFGGGVALPGLRIVMVGEAHQDGLGPPGNLEGIDPLHGFEAHGENLTVFPPSPFPTPKGEG
jgi:hypothetical protein